MEDQWWVQNLDEEPKAMVGPFPTRRAARLYAEDQVAYGDHECPYCGGWHTTSKPVR